MFLPPLSFDFPSFAMPMIVLNEQQTAAGLSNLDVDLATVLRNNQVDKEVQAVLGHFKIVKEGLFSKLACTEDAFRKWSFETLGLDSGMEDSVRSAALTEAWSASRIIKLDDRSEKGGSRDPAHKDSQCA